MRGETPFVDRADAGRQLASELQRLRDQDVVVLGMPRGGIPVAAEVAEALGAPLDVIGVRKLGAPMQPELGIGAIAEGGIRYVDDRSRALLRLDDDTIGAIEDREREELRRRVQEYRGGRELARLTGKTAIVIDDGLATGVSAIVACRAVRAHDPEQLILAVPVGAPQSVERLEEEADEVVCLHAPPSFTAVGAWYEHFGQTTDDEVIGHLERVNAATGTER